MKKLLLLTAIVMVSLLSQAQKGNNQIGIALEVGVPVGDFGDLSKLGVGGLVRGAYGIGTAGHITLTTGYVAFSAKDEYETAVGVDKLNMHIIPIMLGYRHSFNGFFIEPQIGYEIFGAKAEAGGVSASDSEGAFAFGGGIGFEKNGFEVGARVQAGSKDGSTTTYIGFHVGYNFNLGGSK
jgi:hypothetical protein